MVGDCQKGLIEVVVATTAVAAAAVGVSALLACLAPGLFLQLLDGLLGAEDVGPEAQQLVLQLGTDSLERQRMRGRGEGGRWVNAKYVKMRCILVRCTKDTTLYGRHHSY